MVTDANGVGSSGQTIPRSSIRLRTSSGDGLSLNRLVVVAHTAFCQRLFERYGEVFPSRTVPARLAFKQAIELSSASSHPPQ